MRADVLELPLQSHVSVHGDLGHSVTITLLKLRILIDVRAWQDLVLIVGGASEPLGSWTTSVSSFGAARFNAAKDIVEAKDHTPQI